MYCKYCGHELNSDNICTNPDCPSNLNKSDNANDYRPESEENSNSDNTSATNYNDQSNYTNNSFNDFGKSDYQNSYSEYNNHGNGFRDEYGISTAEMISFIGDKKAEYYLDKWTEYQNNENFVSWNWPAFICGFYWFWYRKMYSIMAIILTVSIVGAFILPDWAGSILSLGITIGCGLFANQLYMKHATKRITSIKSLLNRGIDYDVVMRRIRSNGGTTIVPIIVSIILFVVLALILIFVAYLGMSVTDQFSVPLY